MKQPSQAWMAWATSRTTRVLAAVSLLVVVCRIYTLPLPSSSPVHVPASRDDASPALPRKIWQAYFNSHAPPIDTEALADSVAWLAWHPDYQYVLVGEDGAASAARALSSKYPALPAIMAGLVNFGMKSDLLRYMLLLTEGGVYSDTDTRPLKAIHDWIPKRYEKQAKVVVGIEFDRLDGPDLGFPRNISFSQWTIAAAPGHVLFSTLLEKAVSGIQEFALGQSQEYSGLTFQDGDVLRLTGPILWTNTIFDYLQRHEPGIAERDLSALREPRLVGDVLVLPIDGVAMGVPHSNATREGPIPEVAIVRHGFKGSWRTP